MKKKNLRYLSVVLLAVCLGCKPEKDGVFYLDPAPVFEAKPNPLAPDSINAFRPAIGTPHVTRAFPFGTAGKPAGVRLLEVFDDPGSTNIYYKDKTTYLYAPTGSLIKKTRQTTSGIIWDINSYDSGAGERVQIATEVNNGAAYASGSLEKNQLGLIGTTQFEPTAEEKSWILRTYQRKEEFNGQNYPVSRIRLGFDPSGRLVWEEGIYLDAASSRITSYKLYKRDANGNATFTRYTTGNQLTEQQMTYDDKPNPYRTTGDVLLPEATNPNNILTQLIVETGATKKFVTTLRYEYEYRPDGYPTKVKTYKDEKLTSTKEFKYNQ